MNETRTEAESILAQLGVERTTLSDDERAALDRDGYVVLPGILTDAQVAEMRSAANTLLEAARGDLTRKHGGTLHLDDLVDTAAFDSAWTSPRLLAAVAYVLGADFRAGGVSYRAPKPGYGAQALHADDVPIAPGERYRVATAIVPLVDFTERNGATRVVPGSHRDPPRDAPTQPDLAYPRERIVVARAGSGLVFNGHLWHSGTRNASDARRDALQLVFRLRGSRAATSGPSAANATLDRLGTAALLLI